VRPSDGPSPSATDPRIFDAVEVRRIRADEWASHRELRLRALSVDPLAFGSTLAREGGLSEDRWRERTSRGADSDKDALFVADAQPSGWVGMVAIALVEAEWHVFAMWVDPAFRRHGLGGRLLDAGLRWFRTKAPHEALQLEVNPRQEDAVRLYEGRGFRRTGASSPLGHTAGEVVISMVLEPRAVSRGGAVPPVRRPLN